MWDSTQKTFAILETIIYNSKKSICLVWCSSRVTISIATSGPN